VLANRVRAPYPPYGLIVLHLLGGGVG